MPLETAVGGFEGLDVFQAMAIVKTKPQLSNFKSARIYLVCVNLADGDSEKFM